MAEWADSDVLGWCAATAATSATSTAMGSGQWGGAADVPEETNRRAEVRWFYSLVHLHGVGHDGAAFPWIGT